MQTLLLLLLTNVVYSEVWKYCDTEWRNDTKILYSRIKEVNLENLSNCTLSLQLDNIYKTGHVVICKNNNLNDHSFGIIGQNNYEGISIDKSDTFIKIFPKRTTLNIIFDFYDGYNSIDFTIIPLLNTTCNNCFTCDNIILPNELKGYNDCINGNDEKNCESNYTIVIIVLILIILICIYKLVL